jgi:hypothetical protein
MRHNHLVPGGFFTLSRVEPRGVRFRTTTWRVRVSEDFRLRVNESPLPSRRGEGRCSRNAL